MTAADDAPPFLRVVRGTPTDEELAAVVTVLTALTAPRPAASAPARSVSGWSDRSRNLPPTLHPGPGAWRLSARS